MKEKITDTLTKYTCSVITFPTVGLYLQRMNVKQNEIRKYIKKGFGRHLQILTVVHVVCMEQYKEKQLTLRFSSVDENSF